jgi:hypothetical protein
VGGRGSYMLEGSFGGGLLGEEGGDADPLLAEYEVRGGGITTGGHTCGSWKGGVEGEGGEQRGGVEGSHHR